MNRCFDCKNFVMGDMDRFGTCVKVRHVGTGSDAQYDEHCANELAVVVDGSGYIGEFLVKPNFGCVLHEPKP